MSISGEKVIMGNSQQADKTNLCSIFLVSLVARILGEGAEMVSDLCLAKQFFCENSMKNYIM